MYLEPVSHDQRLKTYSQFNATEESIKNDVQYLKQWMRKQPHLPDVSDEQFLTSLLLQCKNSVENTKVLIEKYYTARAMLPEIFTDRDPCQLWFREFLDLHFCLPLPKPTPQGQRIIFGRSGKFIEPKSYNKEMCIKGYQMIVDVLMKEDSNAEIIMITDSADTVMSPEELPLAMRIVRQYVNLFQNTLKFRPQKIYLLNTPAILQPIFTVAKSLAKKKIADRIVIWNKKSEDLVQVIPKEVLPVEYGGDLKSIWELKNDFYQYMCGFQEWFFSEEKIKADITKIAKHDSGFSELLTLYGSEGTFRKLCLD